ncbi:WEE protein kinase Wee1 [Schizosaccharomyces japonicus yFS275]|uniref:WEE protein kinase Wee1 n=1 Tax=Schizosaccharomyces japonicus (strain yFS275 / FY16936) TaxID=402676 RepID=B6K6E8_SCHJY|nr:WEE protein kinase Wee1 [Schizosaccharomyces japonicus yFS275]EEB09102.1 WEE protein kinase Wee1 [Schizosaccharomyces japonicus yFS275]
MCSSSHTKRRQYPLRRSQRLMDLNQASLPLGSSHSTTSRTHGAHSPSITITTTPSSSVRLSNSGRGRPSLLHTATSPVDGPILTRPGSARASPSPALSCNGPLNPRGHTTPSPSLSICKHSRPSTPSYAPVASLNGASANQAKRPYFSTMQQPEGLLSPDDAFHPSHAANGTHAPSFIPLTPAPKIRKSNAFQDLFVTSRFGSSNQGVTGAFTPTDTTFSSSFLASARQPTGFTPATVRQQSTPSGHASSLRENSPALFATSTPIHASVRRTRTRTPLGELSPPSLANSPTEANFFPNLSLPNPVQHASDSLNTPFRTVKPFSKAFMSTGLLSKANRTRNHNRNSNNPPSTPSKRNSFFQSVSLSQLSPLSPSTPRNHGPLELPTHGDDVSLLSRLEKGSNSFLRFRLPHSNSRRSSRSFLGSAVKTSTPITNRNNEAFSPCTPTRTLHPLATTTLPMSRSRSNSLLSNKDDCVQSPSTEFTLSFPSALTECPSSPTEHLRTRFRNVTLLGQGEFSEVFQVEHPLERTVKYAVKKLKVKYSGPKERQRLLQEVGIQHALRGHDHIVELIDSWEWDGYLYMQTELCENGSLDKFLEEQGHYSRLDEFRVWKILIELSLGLQYIHHQNFVHLDLKPANIMITFEGTLKIGDFGMASTWPVTNGTEREGDCEYIAPEVLTHHQYDKPADVFSLGITVFEAAANIVLPDNGLSWRKLRSGDLSDAPRLSSSEFRSSSSLDTGEIPANNIIGQGGLDRIVQWMLSPNPLDRPTVDQVLTTDEVAWIESRRKAGATIYEGIYGSSNSSHSDQMMEDWHVAV